VIGAIVFRAIFVLAGTALLSTFSWLVFVFGAFLIFTGFRMFCRGNDDGKQIDYQNNRVLSLFRRFVTLTKDYYGDHHLFLHHGAARALPEHGGKVAGREADGDGYLFEGDGFGVVFLYADEDFGEHGIVPGTHPSGHLLRPAGVLLPG